MSEEKVITLTEFKTVIEGVNTNIKRLSEAMLHNFAVVKEDIKTLKTDVGSLKLNVISLKLDVNSLKSDMVTVKKEIGLLHEGQTEIKSMLAEKVDRSEFNRLEKRVARLERKSA